MKKLRYNIVLQPEPEGGFTVLVPSLPGCITYGKDLIEARAMATDAIEGWLYVGKKNKLEMYEPDTTPILADYVEISAKC
ncbi:MAG: type II toxin-antitoxin system HicB family antitoxin [bacterium]|nr:type II toxin-antitoxin system HicB family antitoxin [bacterium]